MDKPDHLIRGFLFDLDGVLVDASAWHREALIMSLGDIGYSIKPYELKGMDGKSTLEKLRVLSRNGRAPSTEHDEIYTDKRKHLLSIVEKKCRPNERIVEAVKYASEIAKCAIVTNCRRDAAILIVEKSGLGDFIHCVVSQDDVRLKKPHALPYLTGAYALGVRPSECLAIDDSKDGIMSAIEARCRILRITKFTMLSAKLIEKELDRLRIRI